MIAHSANMIGHEPIVKPVVVPDVQKVRTCRNFPTSAVSVELEPTDQLCFTVWRTNVHRRRSTNVKYKHDTLGKMVLHTEQYLNVGILFWLYFSRILSLLLIEICFRPIHCPFGCPNESSQDSTLYFWLLSVLPFFLAKSISFAPY